MTFNPFSLQSCLHINQQSKPHFISTIPSMGFIAHQHNIGHIAPKMYKKNNLVSDRQKISHKKTHDGMS